MGKIRPFCVEDIPQVIELNLKLFPGSASLSPETQEFHFKEIAFRNPWSDPDITSLVHEEPNGRISGFLGVIPRKIMYKGRPLRLAVGQHLMVDQAMLAGFQLFKTFISGPQDISMADMAVEVTRKLWERVGGTTAYLHSIFWQKPLRPLTAALSYMKRNKSLSYTAPLLHPFASGMDAVLNRRSFNPMRLRKPTSRGEELTVELMLAHFPEFTAGRDLVPAYTEESLSWLFDILARERRFGMLRKILVRDAGGEVIGWYIYNLNPGGRSEVLQIVGTESTVGEVLEHLFYDAWQQKSQELHGRLDPMFMKAYADRFCLFSPGANWMLVHSKLSELITAVISGCVFLSRLEGDLWFF